MTPSSSDLVSQEGVYLLTITLQSRSIPSSARQADSRSDVLPTAALSAPAGSEVPLTAPSAAPHSSSAGAQALLHTPTQAANNPLCTSNPLLQRPGQLILRKEKGEEPWPRQGQGHFSSLQCHYLMAIQLIPLGRGVCRA